jgi:hypothetical protein
MTGTFRAWIAASFVQIWRFLDESWHWFFYSFLIHFLTYFPLPAALAFVLLATFNLIGADYGVDKVVWHDEPWKQFFVGYAIGLVITQTLLAGYALWLRDGRETPGGHAFDDVGYTTYAWNTLASLTFLAVFAYLAMDAVASAVEPKPLPGDYAAERANQSELADKKEQDRLFGSSLPYEAPWAQLLGVTGTSFGIWLIIRNKGLRPTPQFLFGVLFASVGALAFEGWFLHLLPAFERPYPPHSWPLIGGVGLAVFVFGALVWTSGRRGLGYGRVDRRLAAALDVTLSLLPHRDGSVATTAWQVLKWVCRVFVWAIWAILLYETLPFEPGRKLGVIMVGVGCLVTILAVVFPGKSSFTMCLLVNIMAVLSWLTSVPSNERIAPVHLLLFYPLMPVAFVLVGVLLIFYQPEGARKVFGSDNRNGAPVPAPTAAELAARRRVIWVFGGGWLSFLVLSSLSAMASPALIVFFLLFLLVSLYGIVTYYLRGAAIAIGITLAILLLLSGANRYKFRFPDPLSDLYTMGHGPNKQPLRLHGFLKEDRDAIEAAEPAVSAFSAALSALDDAELRKASYKGALDHVNELAKVPPAGFAQDWPETVKRFNERYNEAVKAEDSARARVAEARKIARDKFRGVAKNNHIIGALQSEIEVSDRVRAELQQQDDTGLLDGTSVVWTDFKSDGSPGANAQDEARPLILIAVSGGGMRAAVWTLLILQQLEKEFARAGRDFPVHVRLITGASGGMLGSACYVGELKHPACRRVTGRLKMDASSLLQLNEQERQQREDQVRRLNADCLTPLMRQFVFGDLPNEFSPWLAKYDRGRALEDAWIENVGSALGQSFEDLRPREKEGWCPSLVFTPMMVEDGRRLAISNLDLFPIIRNDGELLGIPPEGKYREFLTRELTLRGVTAAKAQELIDKNDARAIWAAIIQADADRKAAWLDGDPVRHLQELIANQSLLRAQAKSLPRPFLEHGTYSIEAMEMFRLFPTARRGLKLATAARMSATFPYLSPAVSLPTWPRRRIVDAGYYDNYGVSLSAAWLFSSDNIAWIKKYKINRICIIQIRDAVSDEFRRLERIKPDASTQYTRALEELVSPLEGLEHARVGSSSFRNDGQLELLSQYIRNAAESRDFVYAGVETKFAVVNFEYNGWAALSWRLCIEELEDLRKRASDERTLMRIEALQSFLFDKKRDVGQH